MMGSLSSTEKRKNIAELALLGYTDRDIEGLFNVPAGTVARDYAAELADGRAGFARRVGQFREESAWGDGREAIYWEKCLIRHVRVSRTRVTTEYVRARIDVIPFGTERNDGWSAGCAWPYLYGQKLLWVSTCPNGERWKIFFSPAVICDVASIRASFPSTDTFEPYDSHYLPLIAPLKKFMVQTALNHLHRLIERLNEIEAQRKPSSTLEDALHDVEQFLVNDPHGYQVTSRLLDFLFEAEKESGKFLTKSEADELILGTYLVSGALGGGL